MLKLKENIYAVGAVDADVRMFHGYETPIGTTYNAYLIMDEQITLIDFVKAPFAGVLLDNIREVIGDRPVDNIICLHVEPDHSGALPDVVKAYPNAVVYGSANCGKELAMYYPDSVYEFKAVGLNDQLQTGRYSFNFIPMPMVHWPDSMSCYLAEEKVLFTNDALGEHIGTGERIDTELSLEKLHDRAANYYANIVMPFGMQVQKLLKSVAGLAVEMVCPSHGVVLTKYIAEMVGWYNDWSLGKLDENRIVIVYDTMWGTTEKMAKKYYEEYKSKGFDAEIIKLSEKHYSYALERCLTAKYIFVGSSTLNNEMMPTVAAFLTYMRGLKPKGRTAKAFGSYGWSGESVKKIESYLEDMGFELLPGERVLWNVK